MANSLKTILTNAATLFAEEENLCMNKGYNRAVVDYWGDLKIDTLRLIVQLEIDTNVAKDLLKPVGEVGSMPGTTGFTMAVFEAKNVPVETPLYVKE